MDLGDAVLSHMGLQREVSVHVKNEFPSLTQLRGTIQD